MHILSPSLPPSLLLPWEEASYLLERRAPTEPRRSAARLIYPLKLCNHASAQMQLSLSLSLSPSLPPSLPWEEAASYLLERRALFRFLFLYRAAIYTHCTGIAPLQTFGCYCFPMTQQETHLALIRLGYTIDNGFFGERS